MEIPIADIIPVRILYGLEDEEAVTDTLAPVPYQPVEIPEGLNPDLPLPGNITDLQHYRLALEIQTTYPCSATIRRALDPLNGNPTIGFVVIRQD